MEIVIWTNETGNYTVTGVVTGNGQEILLEDFMKDYPKNITKELPLEIVVPDVKT